MNAIPPLRSADVRCARLADPAEYARIESFVRAHPEGTIFHQPAWARMVERGCGRQTRYLVAEDGGAILGLLPLTEIRSRLFGNALVSAGFGTGGGLLVRDGTVASRLARAAIAQAQQLGCPTVELRGGAVPQGWTERRGLYSGFARTLPPDEDALLASIPKRQRAEVRRGLDLGLTATAGTDPIHRDAFYRAYSESLRNLGTPSFPRALFDAALDQFGHAADIIAVWKEGKPLAALLNFYDRKTFQPYWGGGTAEARRWRANDVIYFEAMRHAIARGCTRADFGRSKVGTGAWQRKKIWGFEEVPQVHAVFTTDGRPPREINPLKPKYRLQVAAWQRLPLWIANRLGPVIARSLG